MEQAAESLGVVNLVGFTLLAVVALRQWRLRRSEPAAWAAASFGGLGAVVLLSRVVPDDPDTYFEHALQRADIIALLVFPYLLFRFTAAFGAASRRLARLISVVTLALALWTILLPEIPSDDEPRSGLFKAYLVAFVVHWTILSIVAAWRLWRAGLGQPGVARRRMHMLSLAAAAITAAIILVAIASEPATELASGLLATISAVAFLFGLAPPVPLRMMWRRQEQAELQRAISSLMEFATSEEEVADRVLRPTTAIVGARGVEIRNHEGVVIGAHGETDGDEENAELVSTTGGSLCVWTSPYAPFFGDEELRLLRTLGSLTGLALDRARLFQQEREARLVLEQAERLKSDFIALAAHELRTPVATVYGIAQTFRRVELGDERRQELQELLVQQMERLALLVDQLLDLSRLDAEAVSISPQRFAVRERVDALVASAASAGEASVEVAIEPELETVADPHAFDRIVSNLVANALRHGAPPVVVAAQQTDRHFRLTVEDHGGGVPPEFVPELFERFTRGGARERTSGTGLGLAIARSYAQAHRGDLRYEPGEPSGSRFLLVLPVTTTTD